jgi:hypothetical protein
MVTIGCYIILYHYEGVSRTNYIGKLKIDRLMAEQSKILDKIPEGSMIYRVKNEKGPRRVAVGGEEQAQDSKEESGRGDSFYQNNQQSLESHSDDDMEGERDMIDIKYMNHTFF